MRQERVKTKRRWSMRDGDLSGKELGGNQPGQAPQEDAHTLKNISRKMTHLDKRTGG